jgi:hypothetical protein
MTTAEVLKDLALWMKRHLETLHARQNKQSYPDYGAKADGYAVVEIPDWELRQKLDAVEEALKSVDILPSCPRCDEEDEHRAQADDGMRTAAEIAGLM